MVSDQGTTTFRRHAALDNPFRFPRSQMGTVTNAVRWALVTVLALHGLLHVLGLLKGFGWAQVSQLQEPIGQAAGVVWLSAALLVLAAAGLLATGVPTWWWAGALVAAAVSQIAIVTSWSDAKAGTAVNVLLVLAAVYAFASAGPTSFPVVDAAGPEMDRGETVTVFNDLVMLAPGAIADAPVRWTPMDAHHVRGDFTEVGPVQMGLPH